MNLFTTKLKSGGLHEKHVVATWNLGNHLSICWVVKKEVTGREWESSNVYFRTFKLKGIRWAEHTARVRGDNCVQTDRHNEIICRLQPTRCNVSQFIYFCKTLYMFQKGFPSIIRSSKLNIQRQVFVRPLLLPVASLARLAAGSNNGLTNT